jgi:tetratricopeptide (TPR) repeat protein
MKLTKTVVILCWLFCFDIASGLAAAEHTVKGVVITPDGTVVPEFSVIVRHVTDKPELVRRQHFKNGEFTIERLAAAKYALHISSPTFVGARLEFDFKSHPRNVDYAIVVLHPYRNEARLMPGANYAVSVKALQQKVPDAARDAYLKAIELHREGKLEEALIEYGKALRSQPQYLEALTDIGTIFLLYNRPEAALTFLRRAKDVDDCNPVVNMNIAVALTEQGDYSGAMKILKDILHREPRMALAQYFVGKIYYFEKKYSQGEDYVRQALENDPRLLDARVLLINVSLEQEKYEQAREGLEWVRQATSNQMLAKFIDEQLLALGS